MNRALVFASEEALIAALTSELIPAAVQMRKVTYWTDGDGAIYVRPARRLTRDVARKLRAAGVDEVEGDTPDTAHKAHIWPRIIRPTWRGEPLTAVSQTVLLYIDHSASRTLLDLAAELLRLGCDRCSYQLLHQRDGQEREAVAVLRAFDPPYYTVAAAGGTDAGYRAYMPVRSGDSRTWMETGYHHPMATAFEPPVGHIGLISGDGEWIDLPDGPWLDLFEILDITLPGATRDLIPFEPPRKLQVRLSLTSATRAEPPSLWVLRGHATRADDPLGLHDEPAPSAIDDVDSMVSTLPDDIITRLLFAVVGPPEHPVVLLRARHGRTGPPSIDVRGVSMVPLLGLPNLFIPHDAMLEPPLRRDTVRDLLAPDDERVYWLAPTPHRGFTVESAPDRAFAPLPDWVEYLVHRSAEELAPWVRSVTFEFQSFQSVGTEWAAGPKRVRESKAKDPTRLGPEPSDPRPGSIAAQASKAPEQASEDHAHEPWELTPAAGTPAIVQARDVSEVEGALAELERAFLDSDTAADSTERIDMWLSMARLLLQIGRLRDAGLCFVRAVWELPRTRAAHVVAEWAQAERAALGVDNRAALLWLPVRTPNPDSDANPNTERVRAVAVHWIESAFSEVDIQPFPEGRDNQPMRRGRALQLTQSWFDAHDSALDVRTLWLLRWSLAAHTGGDPLALARARDRILQSLRGGLSLERDVPNFLRFLGRESGGDSVAAARLSEGLDSLVGLLDRTPRQRSATEAPIALTRSYTWLVIAYGFARLGDTERANQLRVEARDRLMLDDPVHSYLYRAYTARIEQASQGLPPEAPMPPELVHSLETLEDGGESVGLHRYRVDRLRERSRILEPQKRVQAIKGFTRRFFEKRDGQLDPLHGMGAAELTAEVERLMKLAMRDDTTLDRRADLFDGLMDFFPLLPSSRAVTALRTIVGAVAEMAPQRQAELLEEALMLAGHFGRESLAGTIAQRIAELVTGASTADVEKMAVSLGGCFRDLVRVGLRDRVAQLSDTLVEKLGGESVRELGTRVRKLATEHKRNPQDAVLDDLQATISALQARLHVAGSLAYLGHIEQATPIIESARAVVERTSFHVVDHTLDITRALSQALGQCPQDQALSGLVKLAAVLAKVTDNYNTNTHFCLSVIAFMECLVLGYARSDLALGEFGRRFLDEDEYLVRRRIHREIGENS